MKTILCHTAHLLALGLSMTCIVGAVDESKTPRVSVCDLVGSPERFSGKLVVFQAELTQARRLAVADQGCGPITLVFPGEYEVVPRARFSLVEDASFKRLQDGRAELVVPPTMKAGRVRAVFEGRFDSVYVMRNGKKTENDPVKVRLNRETLRLVLRRVKDVDVQAATKRGPAPQHETEHAVEPAPVKR